MSLVSRLTYAANEDDLRDYIGVATGEDFDLELWWNSATECGDLYLGETLFDDLVTGDPLPIPNLVKLGVFEFVRVMRNAKVNNTTGSSGGGVGPVKTIKTGDNSITYETTGGATGGNRVTPTEEAQQAAKIHWCKLRGSRSDSPSILLGF